MGSLSPYPFARMDEVRTRRDRSSFRMDCARAWLTLEGRAEGATSADGRVRGSYLHGLFTSDAFRARFLADLGHQSDIGYDAGVEATLDALAAHLERYMDIDRLLELAEPIPARAR